MRQATPTDWPVVAALLQANELPLDGAKAQLHTFWVAAAEDGAVLGVAGLEVYGEVGLLRSVAVKPERQRLGVGKVLVAHVLGEAARLKLSSVHLLTLSAPNYFVRFGFQAKCIDDAPHGLKVSEEFRGACPAGASFLSLDMTRHTARLLQEDKELEEVAQRLVLQARLTCPRCGYAKTETMPTDACQWFYECENCKALLSPKKGDCCVFCSYGTQKCPPKQNDTLSCCGP